MKDIYEVPVLCIDEFDRLKLTDYAKERIASIVEARCRAAEIGESITLIASNKAPLDYDPYIVDRLHCSLFSIIEIKGHSVRPNLPKDRK